MSYRPHTMFYITIFCMKLVHYRMFINSHITFRSYTFECLMTPSSVCLSPNVIPSQHIKFLRVLLSCPLKDHNFYHKFWIDKYSIYQKSRSLPGYTECRKFSTKCEICKYILWKLMYVSDTVLSGDLWTFDVYSDGKKVNLTFCGNWNLMTSSEIAIREPALSRLSELKSSQSIEISCLVTAPITARIYFMCYEEQAMITVFVQLMFTFLATLTITVAKLMWRNRLTLQLIR